MGWRDRPFYEIQLSNERKSRVAAVTHSRGNDLIERLVRSAALAKNYSPIGAPGPVETESFSSADMLDLSVGSSNSKSDPGDVAHDGWDALMKARRISRPVGEQGIGCRSACDVRGNPGGVASQK